MKTLYSTTRIAFALVAANALSCTGPADTSTFDYAVAYPGGGTGDDPSVGPELCSVGHDVNGARVPDGLCVRKFADVVEARVLAIAPSGEVFVASPSTGTPGGAAGGAGAILVLSDDDHDGTAEQTTFADHLPTVHGLAFGTGSLYFSTQDNVQQFDYAPGQRHATGAPNLAGTFATIDARRWTHGVAVSGDGVLYATQGVYSSLMCPDNARTGSVSRIGLNSTVLTPVATGLRNPMYTRCFHGTSVCLASELGDDGGASYGARERLIALATGDRAGNFGYPCCATVNVSSAAGRQGGFDCAQVPAESASFPLNDTPFGFDWEPGRWPAPFRGALFVALHGSYYSVPQWAGARIAFAPTDAVTHLPDGAFRDVVRGFGPGGGDLDRPADVAFAPDGRLYVADDHAGAVFWVAPRGLRLHAH